MMKTTTNIRLKLSKFKILLLLTGFLLFSGYNLFSQEDESRRARLESARIALITERLQLTPSQAEKFWPVYNEYQKQREEIRRGLLRQRQRVPEEITEAQAKEIIDRRIALQKQEIQLEEQYIPRLIEITSATQVVKLHAAEAEFRRMLLQRLRRRN